MANLGKVTTEFSLDEGTTWLILKGTKSIGKVGEMAPPVEVTDLDDDEPQYIPGFVKPGEKELVNNFEKDDADQKTFRDAADARSKCWFRFTYQSGRIGLAKSVLLGYEQNEVNREEAETFTTKFQQNGKTDWSGGV